MASHRIMHFDLTELRNIKIVLENLYFSVLQNLQKNVGLVILSNMPPSLEQVPKLSLS